MDTSDNTLHIKGQRELEFNTIIKDDTWQDLTATNVGETVVWLGIILHAPKSRHFGKI